MRGSKLKFAFVMSLTLGRIPLILVFLVATLLIGTGEHPGLFTLGFTAMIASELTDLFDGYFARKFQVVSRIGGCADPVIDKIFFIVTLPTLLYSAWLHGEPLAHCKALLLLTVILLARDQWLSFLREIGANYRVDGKANWWGKVRTVVLFVCISTLYYYLEAPKDWWLQIHPVVLYLLEGAGIGLTLLSLWAYTRQYWPYLRQEMRDSLQGGGGK